MYSITQNSKNTKRYLPHDLKTKENAVKTNQEIRWIRNYVRINFRITL